MGTMSTPAAPIEFLTLAAETAPDFAEQSVVAWVSSVAELTMPAAIVWCDGTAAEHDRLTSRMVETGTLIRLNERLRPNSFLARSDQTDVARVESRTFVCSQREEDAGPTNNWRDPMEMRFERTFVDAGGLLMAGCDPTGYGGVVPGFGDQRNVELLVEAGFTPVEAIRIASLNGAKFMGKDAVIGSIAVGKAADIVVLGGNPAEKIDNMEKVELVFKDGVGYDPAALIQSVSGLVGLR